MIMHTAVVRPGGPWDHKPQLQRMFQLDDPHQCAWRPSAAFDRRCDFHFPIEGDGEHEYYYDIWSNIHYGYVGRAAGFSALELQLGHRLAGGWGDRRGR